MNVSSVHIRRWDKGKPPQVGEVERLLAEEGLSGYRWSNAPGDAYAAHSHGYHKVIYVVRGSIVFGLPESGGRVELNAGDRLELPAGVLHDAQVGPGGVECIEAHRA